MKTIFSKITLFAGAAMVGVAGYLLAFMMELGVSFENAFWFLGLVVGGMILTSVSIGHNHKTMSVFGLLMASLAGVSFFRMALYIQFPSAATVGLPAFAMFIIVIFMIIAYALLVHALPDMPANPDAETE